MSSDELAPISFITIFSGSISFVVSLAMNEFLKTAIRGMFFKFQGDDVPEEYSGPQIGAAFTYVVVCFF